MSDGGIFIFWFITLNLLAIACIILIWSCLRINKEEENERNNIRDDSRR